MAQRDDIGVVNITEYCLPGIYQITSLETKRAFFADAENVFFDMREFFDNVKEGYCENQQFLEDFKSYGSDNFEFVILNVGPELADETVRKNLLKKYKNNWKDGFY